MITWIELKLVIQCVMITWTEYVIVSCTKLNHVVGHSGVLKRCSVEWEQRRQAGQAVSAAQAPELGSLRDAEQQQPWCKWEPFVGRSQTRVPPSRIAQRIIAFQI